MSFNESTDPTSNILVKLSECDEFIGPKYVLLNEYFKS